MSAFGFPDFSSSIHCKEYDLVHSKPIFMNIQTDTNTVMNFPWFLLEDLACDIKSFKKH
jgi:hypothetical protein